MTDHQPRNRRTEPPEGPGASADRRPESVEDAMTVYAARSGMRRTASGQLDVMHAVGGVRGLIEALLPGIVFLGAMVIGGSLGPALIAALVVAAVFTVVRLAQRQPLTQALTGLAGVAVCAVFSRATGQALDFYVPGFWTNGVYAVALAVSLVAGWPLLGVVFGYIRGEGASWRHQPVRRRAYTLATAILLAMFLARLAVQLPLYAAGSLTGLGIARLLMGMPLYAAVLWAGWMVSRPAAAPPARDAADDERA